MNAHERKASDASGYPEAQPRRRDGSEPAARPGAPHEPQNVPDEKPQPSP